MYSRREHDKLRIFRAVTQGIAAMHAEEPPITHRDVKAENVLQRSDGSWCLCDFGSATDFSGMLSSRDLVSQQETQVLRMTTPLYRSPELWDLVSRGVLP